MARTLAYHKVHHTVLLCALFIVRSTAEDCPRVLVNNSCKDTFILQTNGTVAFDCVTDHKSDSKWWKNHDNECTSFASLDVKPPVHKAILNDNFTLHLFDLTYEDNATYTCIFFEDIIASYCLFPRVMTNLSIVYNSKIADEGSPITIFGKDKLNITCKTGPTYPAVNLSWIVNDKQHPSETVENKNEDFTANYSTTLIKQFTPVTSVNISCGYRSSINSQLVKKSIVLHVNVITDLSIVHNSKIVDGDSPITTFVGDNLKLKITCKTGRTNSAVNLSWIINDVQHPSKTVENENEDFTANYTTTLVKQFTSVTSVNISCGYRSSSNSQLVKKSFVVNINVLPILCISINGENVTGTFVAEIGRNYTIECVAYGGRPAVNLTWKKDKDPNITEHERIIVSVNTFNGNLFDTKLSMADTPRITKYNNITCFSFGRYPEQENSSTLFIKIHTQPRWWLYVILPTTFALLLLVIWRVACRYRTHKLDTDIFMADRRNNETHGNFPISTYGEDGLESLPLTRKQSKGSDEELIADIKRDEVSTMTTLPGRSYLQYFKGYFTRSGKSRYIIVKTVKEQASVKDMYAFVTCCNLMQCLPRQESIVTLLGISIGEMPIYSYHEYVEGLTLRDYMLCNFQSSPFNAASSTTPSHSVGMNAPTCNKELYVFAENVANGMNFLVSHNFSHPVLSTRKVLLNINGRCKLYDIWPDDLVLERMRNLLNQENPPLAWMAPECIFLGQYHPKTDVWSYGILLWELFSFGETPYYTKSNSEIEQELRNSRHLAIPPNCPGSIFSIMLSSWNKKSEQRPTFQEICRKLSCLLRSLEQEEENESVVSQEISLPNEEYFTLDNTYSEM